MYYYYCHYYFPKHCIVAGHTSLMWILHIYILILLIRCNFINYTIALAFVNVLETCFIFSLLAVVFHHYSTLRVISTWCEGKGVKVIFLAWSRGQRVFLGGSGKTRNEGNGNGETEMRKWKWETEMRKWKWRNGNREAETSYTN